MSGALNLGNPRLPRIAKLRLAAHMNAELLQWAVERIVDDQRLDDRDIVLLHREVDASIEFELDRRLRLARIGRLLRQRVILSVLAARWISHHAQRARNRDFRFACPRWHLYTPDRSRAHEILFGAQSCSSKGRHLSPRRRSTDWRPCFQGISQTPLHTCALSSPRGLRCTRPRVSLPAPAAPRSSAACRRRAAGSDALLPAGASSTGHASRAGPRSLPAAAGDS